jgi:hypothetical protein
MITRQEFLGVVLPPKGFYCVVGIKGKIIHSQTFHSSLAEVDDAVEKLEGQKLNSFVALASFETDGNRTAVNASELKSFFLDLDCGVDDLDKKYPDKNSAVADLKQFVKEMKLPRPMVVDSGNGVHAYWPLTAPVKRDEWKVVAERFKAICAMKGLKIDFNVPADAARVLRAVDSHNFKDIENPRKVSILTVTEPMEFAAFKNLMGISDTATLATRKPLDEATKSLLEKQIPPASFKLILKKSLSGSGCKQIADYVVNQATAPYDMWRAALSVAQVCNDRDKAIHLISRDHPEYSHAETEKKANDTHGAYSCATFQGLNPSGCDGCKFKGKITNPLKLGRGEIEAATPEDNKVVDAVEPERIYTIPDYPFPYIRGKRGGIFVKTKDEDDNPKDVMIYENDFYLVNTVDDPLVGMAGLFRLHLPKDGVKEFLIPMMDMIAKDKFGAHLAKQGVSATGKGQMESIMNYTGAAIKSYQQTRRAEKSRLQFGWTDNHTAFIIGDRQITAAEVSYSPPSSQTLGMVKKFRRVGALSEWKKIAAFYNRPGMELHMFMMFSGFSSALVPFSNQKGGIISLHSTDAGTGKTTMLRMINSIFGHPDDLMLIRDDTPNARAQIVGTLQNYTVTLDEITNDTPEALSQFLYNHLHGRGKERQSASANSIRLNTVSWLCNLVTTGNSTLEDKLLSKKRNPDGELARFLEFQYLPGSDVDKAESDTVFDTLKTNYGVAGEQYVQYLIREMDASIKTLSSMQKSIDKAAKLTQRERYWSTIAATTLTGGLLARASGVLDFSDDDFERVFKWIIAVLKAKRQAVTTAPSEPSLMLGAFLSEHINDALIINGGIDRKANMAQEAPIREPRGKLYIRYEPDTKHLYINKRKFREYCTQGQISYASVIAAMTSLGCFVADKKARMGKGTPFSQPEAVLIFSNAGEKLFEDGEVVNAKPRVVNTD